MDAIEDTNLEDKIFSAINKFKKNLVAGEPHSSTKYGPLISPQAFDVGTTHGPWLYRPRLFDVGTTPSKVAFENIAIATLAFGLI